MLDNTKGLILPGLSSIERTEKSEAFAFLHLSVTVAELLRLLCRIIPECLVLSHDIMEESCICISNDAFRGAPNTSNLDFVGLKQYLHIC